MLITRERVGIFDTYDNGYEMDVVMVHDMNVRPSGYFSCDMVDRSVSIKDRSVVSPIKQALNVVIAC